MPREVTIRPVLNGFVCSVGCQIVVFTDTKSLARAVEEYYDKPEETEKRYLEKALNRTFPQPGPTGPCPDPVPARYPSPRVEETQCCGQQQAGSLIGQTNR